MKLPDYVSKVSKLAAAFQVDRIGFLADIMLTSWTEYEGKTPKAAVLEVSVDAFCNEILAAIGAAEIPEEVSE